MNANNDNGISRISRGPCGDVNYVTDIVLEQETLTASLIDLACAMSDGGEEALPDLSTVIIGGLFVAGATDVMSCCDVRQMTQYVMCELMRRCSRRTRPPFDMRRIWNAHPDVAAMKTLVLLGVCGTAANAVRTDGFAYSDRTVSRHFVSALTTLAEEENVSRLLPLAREIGRVNFRCLDQIGRRRRLAASEAPVLQLAASAGPDDRILLRDEIEAEGVLRKFSTHSGIRALRNRSARTSVSLSWYGPASVCMLFTLLSIGVRDILLGPDRPTFIPPVVASHLEGYFNLDRGLFL